VHSVEQATSEDIVRVSLLDVTVLGDTSRHELLSRAVETGRCLVVREGEDVAGFMVWDESFYGHTFIRLLIVRPDHRRRGIASALLRRVERLCSTGKLFTSTNRSNSIMRRLLEKRGFVKSGHIENLDEGDPEIVYFKSVIGNS